MKASVKKLLAMSLVLGLLLASCGPKDPAPDPSAEPSAAPTPSAATAQTAAPSVQPAAERTHVNLAVLSGPTGVGAAKLLADSQSGDTRNDYTYTVETDNSAVTTKLVNGEYDIAALATNVAANLYHKTNGGVQIAAINTLGVLYILGKGVDGTLDTGSLASLAGRTLYATGQGANPEYVLDYLLTANGVDPDQMDIQWMAADQVTATMLQSQGEAICMLPVPAATALIAKSEGSVQPLFSLSDEWDKLQNGSQLTMGCVVVRTQFAQENPQAVKDFLTEYAASIAYVAANPEEMGQTVADLGIAPSAPIASKAIPQCNLVCVTGTQMRDAIQGYYEALYAADPASIGGGIPDDGFYFLGE